MAELPLAYRGSVKDVYGPVPIGSTKALVFEFSDAFSVFDWGRMPDKIEKKGSALATLAADWMGAWEKPETWAEFSRSETALQLRKASRFGAAFAEVGERLQTEGLRTHLLGCLKERSVLKPVAVSQLAVPGERLAVLEVHVARPEVARVLGREVYDYSSSPLSPLPRLVPLEVVFRFDAPAGSSITRRLRDDPQYLEGLGFEGWKSEGPWEFPVLELFTKLETTDRVLSPSEALLLSGLDAEQMQSLLFQTAWVAGWLKERCKARGLHLSDGKLEWALSPSGDVFMVDAVGPDELRISHATDGGGVVSLSKEWLRTLYRGSSWFEAIEAAKVRAAEMGQTEWKKSVTQQPPQLSEAGREIASQLYQSLANALGSRVWFPHAWSLSEWIDRAAKHRELWGGARSGG